MLEYIFDLIAAERQRQDAKFAEGDAIQNTPPLWLAVLVEEVGEVAAEVTAQCPMDTHYGRPDALRKELVQVAAVAVAWLEALEREAR